MRDFTYYVKNELLQVSMEPGYVDKFDIELRKSRVKNEPISVTGKIFDLDHHTFCNQL